MVKGAPHCESEVFQWGCPVCGKRIGEPRDGGEIQPYRYLPMNTVLRSKDDA